MKMRFVQSQHLVHLVQLSQRIVQMVDNVHHPIVALDDSMNTGCLQRMQLSQQSFLDLICAASSVRLSPF
jgi:hypothetical protein